MAILDYTKMPKDPKRLCCERCGKVISNPESAIDVHYNYDTFEIRLGSTTSKGPWGNNAVIGPDCAKAIGLEVKSSNKSGGSDA